jgi:chorismate mutase
MASKQSNTNEIKEQIKELDEEIVHLSHIRGPSSATVGALKVKRDLLANSIRSPAKIEARLAHARKQGEAFDKKHARWKAKADARVGLTVKDDDHKKFEELFGVL